MDNETGQPWPHMQFLCECYRCPLANHNFQSSSAPVTVTPSEDIAMSISRVNSLSDRLNGSLRRKRISPRPRAY